MLYEGRIVASAARTCQFVKRPAGRGAFEPGANLDEDGRPLRETDSRDGCGEAEGQLWRGLATGPKLKCIHQLAARVGVGVWARGVSGLGETFCQNDVTDVTDVTWPCFWRVW